jgi:hypothetical protein
MPNPPEKRAAPLGLVALSLPAAVCFVGWSVDATVRYSTGGRQASLIAALPLVGGSFAAIVPVVVLIARITKNPSERRWPGYLVLSVCRGCSYLHLSHFANDYSGGCVSAHCAA